MPREFEYERSDKRAKEGFEILIDVLKREAQKNQIRAAVTDDRRQKQIFEVQSLEYQKRIQRLIRNAEERCGAEGSLKKYFRERAQRAEIKAALTNDPIERLEYQKQAAEFKRRRKEIQNNG